jgi:DnaK suppressor protein
VAPKKVKSSGKGAKQGAKAHGPARPVRKTPATAAKPAKKAARPAAAKKSAPPAARKSPAKAGINPAAGKKAAAKPAAKKAVAKVVAAKPRVAAKAPAVKSSALPKATAKPRAQGAKPAAPTRVATALPAAKSAPAPSSPPKAPRHPQRPSEVASAVKPASSPASVARPAVSPRPMPPKRPFSRESVRVGESRFAQPAGVRPVFPAEFLERQRERLLVKKQEILAMYQKDLKSGQESNDSPTEDLVDRANNAYTRELAFSISDSERELMHQIDLAIERLKSGSYGFCLHTGQQIGQARLEAIPWAKYSVEAQELLEKGLLSEA